MIRLTGVDTPCLNRHMTETRIVAAIMSDPEYSRAAMVERRRWRVALSIGPNRRRFTTTRREAIEWCEERGIPYVLAEPVRPRLEARV